MVAAAVVVLVVELEIAVPPSVVAVAAQHGAMEQLHEFGEAVVCPPPMTCELQLEHGYVAHVKAASPLPLGEFVFEPEAVVVR